MMLPALTGMRHCLASLATAISVPVWTLKKDSTYQQGGRLHQSGLLPQTQPKYHLTSAKQISPLSLNLTSLRLSEHEPNEDRFLVKQHTVAPSPVPNSPCSPPKPYKLDPSDMFLSTFQVPY